VINYLNKMKIFSFFYKLKNGNFSNDEQSIWKLCSLEITLRKQHEIQIKNQQSCYAINTII